MKFIISREKLVLLISKVQNVIPSKAIVPILSNILLEAKNGILTLYATDLTVSVKVSVEVNIIKEGAITLPAKRFFQLIRELTAPEIQLETSEAGIARITAGSSHFRLHGIDKEQYPAFPSGEEGNSFSIRGGDLKDMLMRTSFAAAKDDTRQVLNGVFMEIKGNQMVLVGTDGKRLAKVHKDLDLNGVLDCSNIIPLKAVDELIRVIVDEDQLQISIMDEKISVEMGNFCLITKLISGQFPDYERVIPDHSQLKEIKLHREELMTLLKQISLFTSDVSHSVKLTFSKGELKLQATSSDIGEGKVNMPVDHRGEDKEIAFNPHYFLDVLRHCKDETVNFCMTDSFNPGSITDTTDAHYVIMPMRLG
jgi:DNA polymerase-3 subunit beta